MNKLKRQLPPLPALVTFEASARHQSFTQAATELHVTQAAISRHIRMLEDDLGVKLFQRAHRRVRLTVEGLTLQQTVTMALGQIAATATELRGRRRDTTLSVATDQSIASLLLMPRLADFRALHPGIAVRLVVSDIESDLLSEDVDVAIVHGTGSWPGFTAKKILHEEVFPVCSASYATKARLSGVKDLADHTLIELEDDQWQWMTWQSWFAGLGVHATPKQRALRINNYPLLIQAAIDGQGVALGWRYLVDDLISNGDLVRPIDDSVTTEAGYFLLTSNTSDTNPNTREFVRWCNDYLKSGSSR